MQARQNEPAIMMSSLYRVNTNFAILRINRTEIMMGGGTEIRAEIRTAHWQDRDEDVQKKKTRHCVTRSLLRVLEDAQDINRTYFVW